MCAAGSKPCEVLRQLGQPSFAKITDAAAISNDYTRECDREDIDVADLNLRASHFVLSARSLFVDRKVLTLPTFTKEFLDRRIPVTILQDGFALDIQVSNRDLDRAFAVMEDPGA